MNEINIIKDYISKETCNLLCKIIGPETAKAPDPGVWGGPSCTQDTDNLKLSNPILPYRHDSELNIGIDLITMLSTSMTKTVSDFYNGQHILRSLFYGKFTEGAKNKLHIDNLYLNANTNLLEDRPNAKFVKSAILYLNNQYSGGEITFPLQDIKMRPDPGTLIFFEGTEKVPHEVLTVTGGERHVIITFFWPPDVERKNANLQVGTLANLPEKEITLEYLKTL